MSPAVVSTIVSIASTTSSTAAVPLTLFSDSADWLPDDSQPSCLEHSGCDVERSFEADTISRLDNRVNGPRKGRQKTSKASESVRTKLRTGLKGQIHSVNTRRLKFTEV